MAITQPLQHFCQGVSVWETKCEWCGGVLGRPALGVCGACVGCVWGVCVVCVWRVQGVCRACAGRAWGVCVGQEVLVLLAPLYYPDTLVNPDTCLGTNLV